VERLRQYDTYDIQVGDIYFDYEFNCRGQFTVESLSDLAANIKLNGLLYPVDVQPVTDTGGLPPPFKYRLLTGYRRFRAVDVILKWKTIPARIHKGLTEHQAHLLNYIENLERKDLNIFQEAQGIQNLYPNGVTLHIAQKELKRPSRWIHIRLRLLKMPESVQKQAAAGLLSAVNIEAIAQKKTPEEMEYTAKKIVTEVAAAKRDHRQLRYSDDCRRSFKRRKSKAAMQKMSMNMLHIGLTEGPRTLAWACGEVKDKDFMEEFGLDF
jgi:ParB/RepB/Spo0J family partition protein